MKYLVGGIWYLFTLSYLLQLIEKRKITIIQQPVIIFVKKLLSVSVGPLIIPTTIRLLSMEERLQVLGKGFRLSLFQTET